MKPIIFFLLIISKYYATNININSKIKSIKFGTKIVHAGCETDEITGNIIPSITLGTTFAQKIPGEKLGKNDINSYNNGYFYSRQANPTRGSLERALAIAENANHGAVFSSGMAAISTVFQMLKAGDHVITSEDIYGGTYDYFLNIASKNNGISFTYMNFDNLEKLEDCITSRTKLIWLESLTNPLLKTFDIKKIVDIAAQNDCLVVVDSTFSSPYLLNALDLGVDIVVHSCTKYIAGHSDVIMGALLCNNDKIIKNIRFIQTAIGAIPSPFECYLTLRGLKTLKLRIDAAQKNALILAKYLENHPLVEKVIYPGLENYKYKEISDSQNKGNGGIIAVYLKGDLEQTKKFLQGLKIFTLAVSLGAVESLICCPSIMTSGAIPKDKKKAIGLTDNLLRISVGIEDPEDLIDDLNNGFDCINNYYTDQKENDTNSL